ncbi:MAG: pectate lyase [Bacteroidales bacterium]
MKLIFPIVITILLTTTYVSAQDKKHDNADNYLKKKWKQVAIGMPLEWYGSAEAKSVAENVLLYQRDAGGWPKNTNFHQLLSDSDKENLVKSKSKIGATFDNGATITELEFLAKIYSQIKDGRYKQAFEKGLEYIFDSQYENGGWPQFYPYKGGYSNHITYNDNAMVNTMNFLKEIYADNKEYASLVISNNTKVKAKKAFNKGVECILKTQIVIDGNPTVWCAQHDEITLAPANARSYELVSFSGGESVGIVLLLMGIDDPSKEVIASVNGAVSWFENHKIKGKKIESIVNEEGKRDRVVVEDKDAPALWGRFHDLETGKPYFCDRDGIRKNSLAEIGHERRNGYSWYTTAPEKILEKYPEWKNKIN